MPFGLTSQQVFCSTTTWLGERMNTPGVPKVLAVPRRTEQRAVPAVPPGPCDQAHPGLTVTGADVKDRHLVTGPIQGDAAR